MSAPHERLAGHFRHFAVSARATSPLYAVLADRIAEDAELLALAARIPADKMPPNMLFAAVHALLTPRDALARFYLNFTDPPLPREDAFPLFRQFALDRADEIVTLCETRRTSTNEMRRAAVLLPAFGLVARQGGPLHCIEVGCAAGLLLNWDRVAYDYGDAGGLAPPGAAFALHAAAEGPVPVPAEMPRVASRVGLDLVDLDPTDPGDADWLRALIWPELTARRERLDQALALAQRHPPRRVIGDALATLPSEAGKLPAGGTIVVFHSFALNQFPVELKAAFIALLEKLGATRPLWRVGYEHGPAELAYLSLQRHGVGEDERLLAEATPHGERLRWLDPAPG